MDDASSMCLMFGMYNDKAQGTRGTMLSSQNTTVSPQSIYGNNIGLVTTWEIS